MNTNRGRPLSAATVRQIQRLREVHSIRGTAKVARVSRNTARKYMRKAA